MALWNADTVKDVSESVGIPALADDVAKNLAMDVEYRLHQVLQEALKFMRHSKRTTLATTDISNALRVLDVEPLYGYESTRPLKYAEASLGQAQPIYYVEDDEVDFEKLINAPLPKMPREVTFTAHWLAIEGVQPAIPMNPTPSESARQSETTPKGAPPPPAPLGFSSSSSAAAGQGPNTAAGSGSTAPATADVAVRPLVKHILSKELQLYFDRVCSAVTDEANDALRAAALASLRNDPGLHQLLPYFVQWISERVTHGLKHLFVLSVMLQVTHALLENANLFIEPYVAALIPPILTCLIGKRLGGGGGSAGGDVYELRDLAASLLKAVCRRFGDSSHTLKPRLTRTCLKHFLDPAKPWGTHYGAIMGLAAVGGREAVRVLVLPNVKLFVEGVVKGAGDGGGGSEAERVVGAVVGVLRLLEEEEEEGAGAGPAVKAEAEMMDDGARDRLVERVGETVADYVWRLGRPGLVKAIVEPLGVL